MVDSSKNSNYQQLNYIHVERILLYDKNEGNYYLLTSTRGFRKAIDVGKKLKLNASVWSLLLWQNNIFIIYNIPLPCIVTMLSLTNTFEINIFKAFWDYALSLCKPAKQF